MLKMIKSIAAVLAVSALMVGSAGAAEKLAVKGTDGTTTKFSVTETGSVAIGTSAAPTSNLDTVSSTDPWVSIQPMHVFKSASKTRFQTNNNGISYWYLHDGTPGNTNDAGLIAYGTPGGKTGIAFFLGGNPTYTNRWNVTNNGTYFSIYPQLNYTLPAFNITESADPNVGISVINPTAKLEVNGGVRLNTATTRPACTTSLRGTIWFTQGTTDTLAVCAQTGTGLDWKIISLP